MTSRMTDSTPLVEKVAKAIQPLLDQTDDALTIARAALDASGNDELLRALKEARDLAKSVRKLVRAENSRVTEARRRGKDVMDVGSRDEADLIQADIYERWPAKRLDALIAAIAPTQEPEQ